MPLSQEFQAAQVELGNVQTAIDALPATPLEADLPDIVAIVASIKEIVDTIAGAIATARINQ